MNRCMITSENNVGICEAVNCFSQATVQIEVNVGELGRLTLSLCEHCVGKFVGDN
jgi:hypothetical protein